MDFDFSEDQQALRDAVRKWVDKAYDFESRRKAVAAGGFSRDTWNQLAELGLTGLAVPEAQGGMGLGPIDAMVVLEEAGRGMVLEPLVQAIISGVVLSNYAPEAVQGAWLPKVASGEALIVLAYQERKARYDLNKVEAKATQAGDAWTVTGEKGVVPAADQADAFIVPAVADGKTALFLVERSAQGVATTGYVTQDGSRAGSLTLNGAAATLITADGAAALQHAVDVGIAGVSAQAVGAMDKFLVMTAEYLNQRKQFCVALSTFQGLRFRMAEMKMALELGRSMSYYGTLKLTQPAEQRKVALARTKVQIGNSTRFLGQNAVQLHGGIGITDEYVGSHYFKYLTQIDMTFGDTLHNLGVVSENMKDTASVAE
jgi:alkylation response protein AidB-like acyl-CoA dehydrogenase